MLEPECVGLCVGVWRSWLWDRPRRRNFLGSSFAPRVASDWGNSGLPLSCSDDLALLELLGLSFGSVSGEVLMGLIS